MPLTNINQLFLPDIHILPNKVSLIQTRDKTGLIHWLSAAQIEAMMEVEHEKKYLTSGKIEPKPKLESPTNQVDQIETDQQIDDNEHEWRNI